MTSIKMGTPKNVNTKEIITELKSHFIGNVIFKPILKSCNIGTYNAVTGSISNVNKDILYYGFDWFRDKWRSSIPTDELLPELKLSDFSSHSLDMTRSTPSKKIYVISGETIETNYKIAHQIVDGKDKLIRFSKYITIRNGSIEEDVVNNIISSIMARPSDMPFSHFSIKELDFKTGLPTGVEYKSTDTNVVEYNKFINAFGQYASCQTMVCLSSLKTLKKEYYPVNIYQNTPKGTSFFSKNVSKRMLKINNSEYLVPWYISFNNLENDVQIEIRIDNSNISEGEIRITVPVAYKAYITLSGDTSIMVNTGMAGSTITKEIKIKLVKPIEKDTVLEARFFPKNKTAYLGDVISLLNIFRNKTEYNLVIRNVSIAFNGNLSNVPIFNNNNDYVDIDFSTQQVSINNKYFPVTNPTKMDVSPILGNNNLQTYYNFNYDFLESTLCQALIRTSIFK